MLVHAKSTGGWKEAQQNHDDHDDDDEQNEEGKNNYGATNSNKTFTWKETQKIKRNE